MNSQSSFQVIRLAGELDLERRDEIRATLQLTPGGGHVLIDMADVAYADSTIIAELLRLRSEAQVAGLRIAIQVGNSQFARVLQYAGLSGAFAVFDDRAAALTYLGGNAA